MTGNHSAGLRTWHGHLGDHAGGGGEGCGEELGRIIFHPKKEFMLLDSKISCFFLNNE